MSIIDDLTKARKIIDKYEKIALSNFAGYTIVVNTNLPENTLQIHCSEDVAKKIKRILDASFN